MISSLGADIHDTPRFIDLHSYSQAVAMFCCKPASLSLSMGDMHGSITWIASLEMAWRSCRHWCLFVASARQTDGLDLAVTRQKLKFAGLDS